MLTADIWAKIGVLAALVLITAIYGYTRKPRVLVIGDSISISYTEPVRQILAPDASVVRIPENASSTVNALQRMETWLKLSWKDWLLHGPYRVITFNFGLHDLALHTGVQNYESNLQTIVARLKQTGAKLIFVQTTDVPSTVSAYDAPQLQAELRRVAAKVMAENGVPIIDPQILGAEQIPNDVHYTPAGGAALAVPVANAVRLAL